jgi:hypothetical protein
VYSTGTWPAFTNPLTNASMSSCSIWRASAQKARLGVRLGGVEHDLSADGDHSMVALDEPGRPHASPIGR